jgi:hypothetical protein
MKDSSVLLSQAHSNRNAADNTEMREDGIKRKYQAVQMGMTLSRLDKSCMQEW